MTTPKSILKQIAMWTALLLPFFFAACNGQNNTVQSIPAEPNPMATPQQGIGQNFLNTAIATALDDNIRSIFQDKSGAYWFGTNGAGVYRYDGNTLVQYTEKDGLANNQVQSIQEDSVGNIWFGTGVFGVSKFDGRTFTTLTSAANLQTIQDPQSWKAEPHDLWFYAGGGTFRWDGNSLAYLPLDQSAGDFQQAQNAAFALSRYAVYCILKDSKGNVWFGTQAQGVCRFDPSAARKTGSQSLTWFSEKGLAGSAVLGLFEDSKGNVWFGNNGGGLFRYDGKSLVNFTEEKGLGNSEFKLSGKSGPNTLARVYAINEDNFGNLWIGTVDAGVWKYDGNKLTHYTTQHGLGSDAVNCIYKDQKGVLWFGTDSDGIYQWNGEAFTKFVVK
jgi:ligand-binding sensor domain-containing protein